MTDTRDDDGPPSADACLSLLSNAHRRGVLLSIYDSEADDEPIPVEEAVPGSIPESLEVSLNHNHLPKLEDHDVIRWDHEKATVAAGPAFEAIETFIERLDASREQLPNDWRTGLDQ